MVQLDGDKKLLERYPFHSWAERMRLCLELFDLPDVGFIVQVLPSVNGMTHAGTGIDVILRLTGEEEEEEVAYYFFHECAHQLERLCPGVSETLNADHEAIIAMVAHVYNVPRKRALDIGHDVLQCEAFANGFAALMTKRFSKHYRPLPYFCRVAFIHDQE